MFQINSTRIGDDGQTLLVNTTFTLTGGPEIDVDVAIFQPQTVDDVLTSLSNRKMSEQRAYDAQKTNEQIKKQLDKDKINQVYLVDSASGKAVMKAGG